MHASPTGYQFASGSSVPTVARASDVASVMRAVHGTVAIAELDGVTTACLASDTDAIVPCEAADVTPAREQSRLTSGIVIACPISVSVSAPAANAIVWLLAAVVTITARVKVNSAAPLP